jgi:sarcosine oxidase, subunit alpha
MAGSCPNCEMRVDGLPGVTTCMTILAGGEVIARERGWPSASLDLARILDWTSPLTPIGFQYRWFRRSPRRARVAEPIFRRLAARGGIADARAAERAWSAPLEPMRADVVVIGGGISGIEAAIAAADNASVVLVERRPQLGGGALARPGDGPRLERLLARVERLPQIRTITGATAFGWYSPTHMLLDTGRGATELSANAWVIATGTYPQPLAFPGNDLPGVMLGEAVRRLAFIDRVRPGRRAVIVTDGERGHALANQLATISIEVAAIADVRLESGPNPPATGLVGHTVTAAHGRRRVTAVSLAPVAGGRPTRIACDLLCIDIADRPADELVAQLGSEGGLTLDRAAAEVVGDGSVPQVAPGVWMAGSLLGEARADEPRSAAAAGRAAAQWTG